MAAEPMSAAGTQATAEGQSALVWDYIKGFHAVHLMATGVETGLFAALDRRATATPDDIAADTGLHPPYVTTWCRTACAWGLLDADGPDRFRLAPFMRQILTERENPRYVGALLTVLQRFGGPDLADHARHYRDGGVFTFQQHGRDFSDLVAESTAGLQNVVVRRLLPGIPGLRARLEAGCRLLDVGCGGGGLMIRIAQAWPNVQCTGVDVDAHGIAAAGERIAAAGLGARVSVMLAGGEQPQARDAYSELTWGNVVPTREEQERLLADAGFRDIDRSMLADKITVLVARKP